jgi:hypothetical protein
MSTQDLLWVWPFFSEQSYEIDLHCYGEVVKFKPGSTQFNKLTDLVNDSISGSKNWDGTTLSDDSYSYYQTSDDVMVIELFYAPPVRIHTFYKFYGNVDTIIIPLDGRHSETNALFGRTRWITSSKIHSPNQGLRPKPGFVHQTLKFH